jgi:hypothetical protein
MSATRTVLAIFAAALLAAATAACETKNPNACTDGDQRPECTGLDAGIDAVEGCTDNPGLCTLEEDCLNDVCVDCTSANDRQSADCTDPAAPVCGTNRDCRACAADVECDSNLCDHGACAPVGQVLFVRPDGDAAPANECTNPATPCKTLTQAIAKVPATGGDAGANRRFIKLMAIGTYTEPGVVIIDDKTVAILGAPLAGTDRSLIDRSTNGPSLDIRNNADVRLERLGVVNGTANSSAHGIICSTSTLVATGIEIGNNSGVGLNADSCQLTLNASLVIRNAAGGIFVTGPARAVVTNNIIVDNGTSTAGGSDFGALTITGTVLQSSVIQSNTAIGNEAITGQPDGIDCRVATITARNNIITGDATKARVAGACMHDHTLYGPDDPGGRLGTGNGNMLIPTEAMLEFVNPAMRDWHIKPTSFAKGLGTTTGLAPEAMTDLDGQPRPQGAPDVGADEIPD